MIIDVLQTNEGKEIALIDIHTSEHKIISNFQNLGNVFIKYNYLVLPQQRKSAAEDKWLDGEWSKEKYHEVIERLDKELAEERQKLQKLIRENPSSRDVKMYFSRSRQVISIFMPER